MVLVDVAEDAELRRHLLQAGEQRYRSRVAASGQPVAEPARRAVGDEDVDLRDRGGPLGEVLVGCIERPPLQLRHPRSPVEGQARELDPRVAQVAAAPARLPALELADEVVIAGDPDDLGVGKLVEPRIERVAQPAVLEGELVIADRADVTGDREDVPVGEVGRQAPVEVGDGDDLAQISSPPAARVASKSVPGTGLTHGDTAPASR